MKSCYLTSACFLIIAIGYSAEAIVIGNGHNTVLVSAQEKHAPPRVERLKAVKKEKSLRDRRPLVTSPHNQHQSKRDKGPLDAGTTTSYTCIGEYEQCPGTGECVMISSDCGACGPNGAGSYLCPDRRTCVADAADCPNLAGTFWDWTLPADVRVNLLVNQLNLTDKINQLTNSAPEIAKLNIPAFQWLVDDVHGVNRPRATSFPSGVTLGQTWSHEHVATMATVMRTEARAIHHYFIQRGDRGVYPLPSNGEGVTFYGPNLNLVRDPRWGRNQEVYSEDPFLTGRLTQVMVKNVQAKVSSSTGSQKVPKGVPSYHLKDVGPSTSVTAALACCKHFAVYDLEDFPVGRFMYNAVVGARDFWENFMPNFEMCANAQKHGRADWVAAGHAMCSYNAVNGIPACGNKDLLDVLRNKFEFEGFIVSDYDAWFQIIETQGYCKNMTCAAATGLNAGCDQEGGGNIVIDYMSGAIDEGLTTEAKVIESVQRLFRARIDLGFFDPPSLTPSLTAVPFGAICTDANLRASLSAAEDGIVMLKNAYLPIGEDLQSAAGTMKTLPLTTEKLKMLRKSNARQAVEKQPVPNIIEHHKKESSKAAQSSPFAITVVGPTAAATSWLQGNYDQPPAWGVISILEGLYHAACSLNEGASLFAQQLPNVDFRGGDASDTNFSVPATDLASCINQCNSDLNCNYFTYDANQNLCYYLRDSKTQSIAPTFDASIVSGARAGLTIMNYGYSVINTSSDVPSLPPPQDERECSIRCLADIGCSYFVFISGILGNSCYLRPSQVRTPTENNNAVYGASPYKCESPQTGLLDVVHFLPFCLDSLSCSQTSTEGLADAVEVSDAIVVVGGLDGWMEAETVDRHTLDLPAGQVSMFDLVAANYSTNNNGNDALPLLAVFVHGGTFLFPNSTYPASDLSAYGAVITAGYPSMMGGLALANIITGKVSPSGKVAASWYKSNSDIPFDLSHESFYPNASVENANGYTYRFFKPDVQASDRFAIDFGFGLSYSSFSYHYADGPANSTIKVGKCQDAVVKFTVTRSSIDSLDDSLENATEIAQMYLLPPVAPLPTIPFPHPLIRLTDFVQLRNLKKGEVRTATLKVNPLFMTTIIDSNDLSIKPDIYTNITRRVFAGTYTISVGPSQPTTQPLFSGANGFFVQLEVTETYDYDDCPVV